MGEQRRPPVTLTRFNGNKRPAEPMELDHGKFSPFFSKNPIESVEIFPSCLLVRPGLEHHASHSLEYFANCTPTAEMTNTTPQSQIFKSQEGDF